jgi:hypothetical protein
MRDVYLRHWRALALIFWLLSLDEMASLHEWTARPLRELLQASGLFHFTWVVVGGLFVLVLARVYLHFLFALPRKTGLLFVAAAALYVSGAIVMEMVGGQLYELYGNGSSQYVFETVVEESLEILGVQLFGYALLAYLSRTVEELSITFERRG